MPKLQTLAALVAVSAALVCAATAAATPATVNLRVEATTGTLFEGPISTDAKSLTKDGTGPHPCDGTNGGVNPSPGPTATGAMDDAATAAGFTWDATWNDGFQDFFISRIGPDTNQSSAPYAFWGVFVNGVASQVGGCQQRVATGDDLLWAYAVYGDPLLRLTAPAKAATGESFAVTVEQTDGSSGTWSPASGAAVEGATTDAAGHATLSYSTAGTHTFKATRANPSSIRSNAQTVCVYTPGSGECGTDKAPDQGGATPPAANQAPPTQLAPAAKDTTPPVVKVTTLRAGKVYRRGPRVLAGDVSEPGGIAQVFLRLRATRGGSARGAAARCRWFSGKRGVFTHRRVPCSRARFFRVGTDAHFSYLLPGRLRRGSYVLDVKVLDKAYNAGRGSVPFAVK
jgi:hypothetical protein